MIVKHKMTPIKHNQLDGVHSQNKLIDVSLRIYLEPWDSTKAVNKMGKMQCFEATSPARSLTNVLDLYSHLVIIGKFCKVK